MKLVTRLNNGELWTKTGHQYSDWQLSQHNQRQPAVDGPELQSVDFGNQLLERKYDQPWYFNLQFPNAKQVATGGGRTAVITTDRKLMTREAAWVDTWAGNSWIFQLYGPVDAAVTSNRIATVLDNGELWTKEGNLGDQWILQLQGAVDVQLSGNRIGVLLNNGELWVKEGSLHDPWQYVSNGVKTFDISGNRIAAVMNDTRLLGKEGAVTAPFTELVGGATQVALDGSTVAVILGDTGLWTKDGGLTTAPWVFQLLGATNVDVSHFDPSSWKYGGGDHSVNVAAEAEAFLDFYFGQPKSTQQALLAGLSSTDRNFVREQSENLYNIVEDAGEPTAIQYGAYTEPTADEAVALGITGDEEPMATALAAGRTPTTGCREAYDRRPLKAYKRSTSILLKTAGWANMRIVFCWNRNKLTARAKTDRRASWKGSWFEFKDGWGELGWQAYYGKAETEGMWSFRWYNQASGNTANSLDAKFTQRLHLLRCSSSSSTINVTLGAGGTDGTPSAGAGFTEVTSRTGCSTGAIYDHVIRGKFNASAEAASHRLN